MTESGVKKSTVLTLNAGSSSIRFALYEQVEPLRRVLCGKLDRIGTASSVLTYTDANEKSHSVVDVDTSNKGSSVAFLLNWLNQQQVFASVNSVGHRVAHGMMHTEPEQITTGLLDELRSYTAYAPQHLPMQIELIEAICQAYPELDQVACFDTAFHQSMPRVASLLPIPRRYDAAGVRRFGFHGLSYEFLMQELTRLGDPAAIRGRVILAHLGNGASMAAVRDGKSIDTSMGFTPTGGLVMGTRSGDLDPGLVSWLTISANINATEFQKMVNQKSGLLGVSESSSDMRDLLAHEAEDIRAAEAVALFCYQAKKCIGSYTAALGGLDTLVFTGGIGENLPVIRSRICAGLEFLGIALDQQQNTQNAPQISLANAGVTIRVIHTDEERMIVKSITKLLRL